jgi:DNA polymerase-3 subunit delta'
MADAETQTATTGFAPAPPDWYAPIWRALTADVQAERLPHAVLFDGRAGTGRHLLVRALAAFLLCDSPDGFACGHCRACHLLAAGSHSDLRSLLPTGKAHRIGIDQIRAAIEFTSGTATLGRRQVLIIEDADRMTLAAANAVLKRLEEPTADTYILLTCSRASALPATVRSRCQQRPLPTPDPGQAREWLREHGVGENLLDNALLAANGRPLLARDWAAQGLLDERIDQALALQAVFDSRSDPARLRESLAGLESSALLEGLIGALVQSLKNAGEALGQQRELFGLLDTMQRLQQSVQGGATINGELLLEHVLGEARRILGCSDGSATLGRDLDVLIPA